MKLRFTLQASLAFGLSRARLSLLRAWQAVRDLTDPFAEARELAEEVDVALRWQCERGPTAVMAEREAIVAKLEHTAANLWATGECERWFGDCDPTIREVSGTVCGPLLSQLARHIGHPDTSCAELFREGAALYGALPASGIGDAVVMPEVSDLGVGECAAGNAELFASLREDVNAQALHDITLDDFAKGRMSKPVRAAEFDSDQVRLAPRFAVVQGEKTRAVDHFSWSHGARQGGRKRSRQEVKAGSVNGHCAIPERISHDHLDDLEVAMRAFMRLFGERPGLWKADIDAAFRRVPLCQQHRWAAGVAYILKGEIWLAFHNAMPFGAASSVYAWHRVGALLGAIARKLLFLPVSRYVDDYFAVERHVCFAQLLGPALVRGLLRLVRPATMKHAMWCFARVVRLLLGSTAISERKLEFGKCLNVLGMTVCAP